MDANLFWKLQPPTLPKAKVCFRCHQQPAEKIPFLPLFVCVQCWSEVDREQMELWWDLRPQVESRFLQTLSN